MLEILLKLKILLSIVNCCYHKKKKSKKLKLKKQFKLQNHNNSLKTKTQKFMYNLKLLMIFGHKWEEIRKKEKEEEKEIEKLQLKNNHSLMIDLDIPWKCQPDSKHRKSQPHKMKVKQLIQLLNQKLKLVNSEHSHLLLMKF